MYTDGQQTPEKTPASLLIKEMQGKPTQPECLQSKGQKTTSVGKVGVELEPSHIAGERVKWCVCFGKHFGTSSQC